MTLPPETPIDPATSTPHADATDTAVAGAAQLLLASRRDMRRTERRREARLAEVVDDSGLRDLTFALTDEVLRLDDDRRAAARFAAVVRDLGDTGGTAGLGFVDRVSLRAGAVLAPRLPRLVMPLVRRRILAELEGVVLPAEDPAFARHVEGRSHDGFRLNVNVLGEAILSDAEAEARMAQLRERIARPDVDYVSLKISAVCANLDVLAFDHSVGRICERLRDLYRDGRGRSSPHVREPRHGGVPRPAAHDRGDAAGARRAGVRLGRRRHRPAGVPARFARRAVVGCASGRWRGSVARAAR